MAVALVALGGVAALPRPPSAGEPGSVDVVVAARDLAGGVVLSAGDLRTVRFPPAAVPAGVMGPDTSVVGRMLAGAVRRGEPLTDARVVSPALARHAGGPGSVAAPVRLADPGVAALLRPGDRVDVVAVTGSGAASTVVSGAEVLAVPQLPDSVPVDGALVVLAVPGWLAPRLIASALGARLAVTLRAP